MAEYRGRSTWSLDAMNGAESGESYYTSLRDATLWSIKHLGAVILAVAVSRYLVDYVRGSHHDLTLKIAMTILLVPVVLGVALGFLIFCFGWMGRVTISQTGIRAPLYSGRRVFRPWREILTAEKGSLNGWPCVILAGAGQGAPLYLMVLGDARRRMIESIRSHAGPNNALTRYFDKLGI